MPEKSKSWYLHEILRGAGDAADGETATENLLQELLRAYPEDKKVEEQAHAHLELGRQFRQCCEESFQLGEKDDRAAFDEFLKQVSKIGCDVIAKGFGTRYYHARFIKQYLLGFKNTHPDSAPPVIELPPVPEKPKPVAVLLEELTVTTAEVQSEKTKQKSSEPKSAKKKSPKPKRAKKKSPKPKRVKLKPAVDRIIEDMKQQKCMMALDRIHPNVLYGLKPAARWQILIDESGSKFWGDDAENPDVKKKELGRWVAVLIPDYASLADLPKGWHAVNQSLLRNVEVLQSLRNSPCGILGIPLRSQPAAGLGMWFEGVESLLELILRMLPWDGHQISLNVWVEQRGSFTPEKSPVLLQTCENVRDRFARVFPEKAECIQFEDVRFTEKSIVPQGQCKAISSCGYADTVAYVWFNFYVNSSKIPAQEILDSTGWLDTCLLSSEADTLREVLNRFETGQEISVETWNLLHQDRAAENASSFVSAILDLTGKQTQENPSLWERYLKQAEAHLYSKAIDLPCLARQVSWLRKFAPEDVQMDPPLRLSWLTMQLAESNHRGHTDFWPQISREYSRLCRRLCSQDAKRVWVARLHEAVAHMNSFHFQKAEKALEGWESVRNMGILRHYAQILSTKGQLAAFTGQNAQAVKWFRKALAEFAKLTESKQKQNDRDQTLSYLVTALMDSPRVNARTLRTALEEYLGSDVLSAIDRMADFAENRDKYRHHILLRYLAQRGTSDEKARYLSKKAAWQQGAGHPWELIFFYRALLEKDAQERQKLLREAAGCVCDEGATLAAISCVILGGLYYEDRTCRDELAQLTERVRVELPNFGRERLTALRGQLKNPIPPLELAKIVLPFNFR